MNGVATGILVSANLILKFAGAALTPEGVGVWVDVNSS
jgi:hypothetical protein